MGGIMQPMEWHLYDGYFHLNKEYNEMQYEVVYDKYVQHGLMVYKMDTTTGLVKSLELFGIDSGNFTIFPNSNLLKTTTVEKDYKQAIINLIDNGIISRKDYPWIGDINAQSK